MHEILVISNAFWPWLKTLSSKAFHCSTHLSSPYSYWEMRIQVFIWIFKQLHYSINQNSQSNVIYVHLQSCVLTVFYGDLTTSDICSLQISVSSIIMNVWFVILVATCCAVIVVPGLIIFNALIHLLRYDITADFRGSSSLFCGFINYYCLNPLYLFSFLFPYLLCYSL